MSFDELRLEDVVKRMNRFEREDEKPFAAVNAISEFNQRAYELFGRPVVQGVRQRIRREALARAPSAARAALVVFRSQSRAVVARARGQGGEGAPAGHLGGAPDARARNADRRS